jgi:hypothetical protein
MQHRYFLVVSGFVAAAILIAGAQQAAARQGRASSATNTQVSMTVSVEARHGMDVPPITREDSGARRERRPRSSGPHGR